MSGRLLFLVSIPIWCDYKAKMKVSIPTPEMFQFQYGAIIRHNFNFLYKKRVVSIPIWCDYKWYFTFRIRQRKNVSIPIWCDYKDCDFTIDIVENGFQFQYGAIISDGIFIYTYQIIMFQFQYGAIISIVCALPTEHMPSFNSNMVRL